MCTKAYAADEVDLPPPILNTVACDGCNFEVNSTNGFVCIDKTNGIKYVSSSSPITGHISTTLVQQSCVRSLSCEVYPQGREGIGIAAASPLIDRLTDWFA